MNNVYSLATEQKILTLIEGQRMIVAENRALLIQILRKLDVGSDMENTGGLPEGVKFPLTLVKDVRSLEAVLQTFEKEKLLVCGNFVHFV